MKEPNEEEILAAKASAKAATGNDAIELIPFPTLGEGFCLLVRPLAPAEYSAYLDLLVGRGSSDANDSALLDATLWPKRAEVTRLAKLYPGIAKDVVNVLDELAGIRDAGAKKVTKLSAQTPADVLERAGLPRERAQELLLQYHHPGQLTLFELPALEVSYVLKNPGTAYPGAVASLEAAKTEGSGYRSACIAAVAGILVWSRTPFEDDCKRWPALPGGALISSYLKLGGNGTAGRRKSL